MKRRAEKNLDIINGFIYHLTHCSHPSDFVNGEPDVNWKELQEYTPEMIYEHAKAYIEEDHVDGMDSPEEICIDVYKKFLVASKEGNERKAFHILEKLTKMRDHDYIDKNYVDKYIQFLSNQ